MKPSPFDEDTFLRFFRTLDERQARLCAAERALVIGRGGITLVSRVTGLSYPTIHKGIAELRSTAVPLALAERGHRLAPNTVGRLLRGLGYSLQANRKDKEGRSPPERATQVAYLNDEARAFLERRQPVISVDAKKKLRHEV